MATPHERVAEALNVEVNIDRDVFETDTYAEYALDEPFRRYLATAAIEALRIPALDPDHSPPSYSPDDWEHFANGFNDALRRILGPVKGEE
jgi:hypothetical protein